MAIFRILIEKFNSQTSHYWTNRYFVNAADIAAAQAAIDPLVAAERGILLGNNTITKARVDDNTPGTDVYDTTSINLAGLRSSVGEVLPLFIVARVDFDVAGGGRPSRKYLRGVVDEGTMTITALSSGLVAALNTYADAVVAVGSVCDPDGQLFIDGVPWPFPAERQLRRGSKKRVTP